MLAYRFVIRILLLASFFTAAGCKSLGFHAAKPADGARALSGFEAISVTGVSAQVALGDAFAVKVEGDPALARQVETRVSKQVLLVAAQRLDPKANVRVRVTLPRLVRVEARAGSSVSVSGLEADRLAIAASEGSRITVAGTADQLEVSVSGASRADARELVVTSANVSVAGASRLDLRPQRAVSGEATGASKVAVWSKPKRIGVAVRDNASITLVR